MPKRLGNSLNMQRGCDQVETATCKVEKKKDKHGLETKRLLGRKKDVPIEHIGKKKASHTSADGMRPHLSSSFTHLLCHGLRPLRSAHRGLTLRGDPAM